MGLTKEQLLIPRYMCIGTPGKPLWPGYHHKHGDIITNVRRVWVETFAKEAPHLFRPMPWWEGRKPEDMPLYLKSIGSERVLEVKEYRIENGVFLSQIDTDPYNSLNYFEPSTEHDYLEYQKQKEAL